MTTRATGLLLLCLTATSAWAGEPERTASGQRPFRTPPAEAQAACAKLELGAACSFTFDGRAHQGTCRRGPEGQGPVACAPDRGPGRGEGKARGTGPGSGTPDAQQR